MLEIKNPRIYLNAPGVINESGSYIKKIGANPLILAGKKAWDAVAEPLSKSFEDAGLSYENLYYFDAYPSQTQFDKYIELVITHKHDVIIGIGGGRVLDTAKAVGNLSQVPIVTIPTVAAQCAAWAAVTIQYDDEGAYVRGRWNEFAPQLVIADPKVMLSAPVRYTYAGIVDTFAKWYENAPSLDLDATSATTRIATYAARVAFEKLEESGIKALSEAQENIFSQASVDVVDAIEYLAGFVGSVTQTGRSYYGFAHPFYHDSTRLAHTRVKLHGEKVAFGIVAQLFLEKKPKKEIEETIRLFGKYKNAFVLEDFAIKDSVDADLDFLSEDILKEFDYVPYSKEDIKQALLDADNFTKEVLGY